MKWAGPWILGLLAAGASAVGPAIEVELLAGQEWVRRDAAIELAVAPWPEPEDGRLAVVLGDLDATELFARSAAGLVYRPGMLLLPPGETEIAVYLVGADGTWNEVARLPLKVLRRGGFEQLEVTPGLDLTLEARLDEGSSPNGGISGEDRNATIRLGVGAEMKRRGVRFAPRVDVVGVSERAQALRFFDEGEEAPKVDLASYALRLDLGRGTLAVGAVDARGQRHLVSSFQSRGISVELPLGARGDVALAAMNGTRIVGWDNLLGLEESRHQVVTGRLGVDLLSGRPGGMRLDVSYVDGSLLPRFGYSARAVNDAETQRGWGVAFSGATAGQRLRVEAGWATSRFENPADPLLAQGSDLVPVEPEEREAFHGGLWWTLFERGRPSGPATRVALAVEHERVDPQYKSVAAFTQADREETQGRLTASWRGANLVFAASDGRDNLDRVPSILTTETARRGANLTVPLGRMGRAGVARVWLPDLTCSYDRVHQRGLGIPPDSGFSASHVPDQLSASHSTGLDWLGRVWRVGYGYARSDQDNRQPGRELADFEVSTHSLGAGVTLAGSLDLGLDLAWESARSVEQSSVERTRRYGVNLLWRLPRQMTWSLILSRTEADSSPRTRDSESFGVDSEWAWRFERQDGRRGSFSGQIYLRYSDQSSRSRDRAFGFESDLESRLVTGGLTLNLF